MTAKDNPFFAKALVNRMWAHFFGIGLVNPVDDLVDNNAPAILNCWKCSPASSPNTISI